MSTTHYNYLHLYANIGKQTYSTAEKETLTRAWVALAETLCEPKRLRFDINGSGYGIAKSSPYSLAKTFWARLDSKGYDKMHGITVVDKDYLPFRSQWALSLRSEDEDRFEGEFFWPHHDAYDSITARRIIDALLPLLELNYAYGYVCGDNMIFHEVIRERFDGGLTAHTPEEVLAWRFEQVKNIPQGAYRRLFDFNVFNTEQIKKLPENTDYQQIPLDKHLTLWTAR